jgi:pyruvate ferredoxin oxidoreductase gamma subunit
MLLQVEHMEQGLAQSSPVGASHPAHLTEIRIHGRGGQGNVIAAYVLAQAAFEEGIFAQAFPSFGPERRGAPVASFVRFADRPIHRHCQVLNPDFLIIQDDGLLHVPGVTAGLRPGGGILISSSKERRELEMEAVESLPDNVVVLAATELANEILGKPLPNTALLAAFLTLTELLPLGALEKALARRFREETLERNLALAREAASRVPAGTWKDSAHA